MSRDYVVGKYVVVVKAVDRAAPGAGMILGAAHRDNGKDTMKSCPFSEPPTKEVRQVSFCVCSLGDYSL
jgi:hypothetical protein